MNKPNKNDYETYDLYYAHLERYCSYLETKLNNTVGRLTSTITKINEAIYTDQMNGRDTTSLENKRLLLKQIVDELTGE